MKELITLLTDIESEIHFRSPYSSKLPRIRQLVIELKSGNTLAQETAIELLPALEAELRFCGVENDTPVIKRIRAFRG